MIVREANLSSFWRVIEDGAGEAAWNMAADETLFEAVAANAAPPAFRLYEWNRPSVSLGRFQNIRRTIQRENCERLNVPLVRRITGGRGILHGDDLTLSLAATNEAIGLPEHASTLAIYRRIAEGLTAALQSCGFSAAMGTCSRVRAQANQGDCFACISQADVVDAKSGRKLLGAALHRRENFFLLQASIPLASQKSLPDAETIFCGAGNEQNALLYPLDTDTLRRALCQNLQENLHITLQNHDWTATERQNICLLACSRYAGVEWAGAPGEKRSTVIDSPGAL